MAKKAPKLGPLSHDDFMRHLSFIEKEIGYTLQDGFEVAGAAVLAEMDRYFVKYDTAISGINMNERSGELRDSLGSELDDSNRARNKFRLKVGVLPEGKIQRIAYLQEYGTRRFPIRPRHAKKLAIPFKYGLNPDGTRKFRNIYEADDFFDEIKYTDDVIYGKKGGHFYEIAYRKDEVHIPGKFFVKRSGDAMLGRIERDLDERLMHLLSLGE